MAVPWTRCTSRADAPREDSRIVEKAIWEQLSFDHGTAPPDTLGEYALAKRSEALAIAQLLLLWHLLEGHARDAMGAGQAWVPFTSWNGGGRCAW